jgi:hypothetical protein
MTTSKSQRFITLEQELTNLRENFLPCQFNLTGDYSEGEIALAVAYRVLAHAEIESYLEDRVLEIATNALQMWNAQKKTKLTLVSLFAFSGLTLDKPPDSLTPRQQSQNLDDKVKFDNKLGKVFNSFRTAVKDNHGIREKNILLLLLPIGIDNFLGTFGIFGIINLRNIGLNQLTNIHQFGGIANPGTNAVYFGADASNTGAQMSIIGRRQIA